MKPLTPDPSPEEIAARASAIRSEWSAEEERRRYRHDERWPMQVDDDDEPDDTFPALSDEGPQDLREGL